jgi:hypothetical protein
MPKGIGGSIMQEYTVIKKGKSIQPCINIPDEFKDVELEIKIRPLRSKGNVRSKLENLFSISENINPFEMIQDARKWQQELRDEWQ